MDLEIKGKVVLILLIFLSFCAFWSAAHQSQETLRRNLDWILNKRHKTKSDKQADYDVAIFHRIDTERSTTEKLSPDLLRRHRRNAFDDEASVDFSFSAFNEDFQITVKHNAHLLHEQALISVVTGDQKTLYHGDIPDCFMLGNTSHGGRVSLAYCQGLAGTILDGHYQYNIEPLTELDESLEEAVLISRTNLTVPVDKVMADETEQVLDSARRSSRQKRQTTTITGFTLEVAIYWDEIFWTLLEEDNALETSEKILRTAIKWNSVQSIMGMSDDLGYAITLKIVSIDFWEVNPSWFVFSPTDMGPTLNSFCTSAYANGVPADHFHLHTMVVSTKGKGSAFVGGACTDDVQRRCAITCYDNLGDSQLSAHELGHNLDMLHDEATICSYPNNGIMSTSPGTAFYGWSTCSKDYLDTFVKTTVNQTCLIEADVSPSEINAAAASIELTGEWIGMTYSEDEICVQRHGPGWYNRLWHIDLLAMNIVDWHPTCQYRSCINMNPGPEFGIMKNYFGASDGVYCGDKMVCRSKNCIAWSDTKLPESMWAPVEGGWTEWSAQSSCSSTCGRGVMLRKRSCTNPIPRYAPPCPGVSVEATVCTNDPCLGETIETRAGEVCTRLINAGAISGTVYGGLGKKKYFGHALGQCEVECLLTDGSLPAQNARFSLFPDGTECNAVGYTLEQPELNGYPRSRQIYPLCVQGECQKIGCDGKNSGLEVDGCGVCGGDGSTCTFFEGIYSDVLAEGATDTIVTIPSGATYIQIWFKFGKMKNHYIELYDDSDTVILASKKNSITDTSLTPVNALGVDWHFLSSDQYLYTYDTPTIAPAVIKLFNFRTKVNIGVSWAYTLPGSSNPLTTKSVTNGPTTKADTTQSSASQGTQGPTQGSTQGPTEGPTQSSTQGATQGPTQGPTSQSSGATQSGTTPGGGDGTAASTSSTNPTTSTTGSGNACGWGYIRCNTGTCISYTNLCDGADNCGDEEDESSKFCTGSGIHISIILITICVMSSVVMILLR